MELSLFDGMPIAENAPMKPRPPTSLVPLSLTGMLLMASPVMAFDFDSLQVRLVSTDEIVASSETTISTLKDFFNQARCQCSQASKTSDLKVRVTFKAGNDPRLASNSAYMEVVAGKNCQDPVNQSILTTCTVLQARKRINEFQGTFDIPTNAPSLVGGSCSSQEDTYTIFLFTDENNDNRWDIAKRIDIPIDTQLPDAPIKGTVLSGDGEITVSFSAPAGLSGTSTSSYDGGTSSSTTVAKNVKGYQILCERADDGAQVFNPPPAAVYEVAKGLCGSSSVSEGGVADAGHKDSGVHDTSAGPAGDGSGDAARRDGGVSLDLVVRDKGGSDSGPRDVGSTDSGSSASTGIEAKDPAFVCSDVQQSAGNVPIKGLENGTRYRFYVVTIDTFKNASDPTLLGEETPRAVEDLWQRYKRSGGKATGGYCFVATAAYGSYDHPHVRILREFRDSVLLPSRLGRAFVSADYASSPGPALWIGRHGTARAGARALLWPATLAAGAYLYTSLGQKLLLVLGAGSLLLAWRRVRRRTRAARAGGAAGGAA
jgi:hypothetical protein